MFEIVKRDGRRQVYDRAKLARSLTQAGVPPYMLAGILDSVAPNPDQDTRSLRADVESELERWKPSAAKRYATTRALTAIGRGSEQAGYGWVCLNPDDVSRLGLRSGDMVWLSTDGTGAPYSIESLADVGRGQAWLNHREMAAMGLSDGAKLAASAVYQEALLLDPLGGEPGSALPAGLSRLNHYSPPGAVNPGMHHA